MFLFDLLMLPVFALFLGLIVLLARWAGVRVALGFLALSLVALAVSTAVLFSQAHDDLEATTCGQGTVSTGHSSWPQCAATTR